MKLSDILLLPKVWKRLVGDKLTLRGRRRLSIEMAERKRKIEALERIGLGNHAVENIYDPPLDPYRKKKDETDLQD